MKDKLMKIRAMIDECMGCCEGENALEEEDYEVNAEGKPMEDGESKSMKKKMLAKSIKKKMDGY